MEVSSELRLPRVAYLGDTAPAGLDACPDVYRAEMARTVRLVTSLVREWDDLRRRYRAAQPDLVSLDAWAKVFDEHTVGETRP